MSKFTVLIFGIALILLFSPTFAYFGIIKIFPTMPLLQAQIVSIIPFILGIFLLVIQRIIKKPK